MLVSAKASNCLRMPEYRSLSPREVILEGLNEPQRKAVSHNEGPLLILAGPGSGKTHVITRRIRYLLDVLRVPPEKILVITFTKEAALAMQKRFFEQSGPMIPVNFGTFHSVFYHILRQSQPFKKNELLTESRKKNLLYPIMSKIRNSMTNEERDMLEEELSDDVTRMLSAFSLYKNSEDLEKAALVAGPVWGRYFPMLFERYNRICKAEKLLDFDDMVYRCRQLFESDTAVCEAWANRFSHILIDEFQDINPQQYAAVKKLSRPPYNLFVVGDDDQSIYGFRGSGPQCLFHFAEEMKADQIVLNVNYRSVPQIVDSSLRMIGENQNRFFKDLKAYRCAESGSGIKIQAFPTREEQYCELVEEIRKWMQETPMSDPGETEAPVLRTAAVLFRTNLEIRRVAMLLEKNHIPYRCREKLQNPYDHFAVKDIVSYYRLASGIWERSDFLRVMNRPCRSINREAVGENPIVTPQQILEFYRLYGEPDKRDVVQNQMTRLKRHLAQLSQMSPALGIHFILKVIGYEHYLEENIKSEEQRKEILRNLEELRLDAKRYGNFEEWYKAMEKMDKDLANQRKMVTIPEECGEKKAVVELMTVHASKGLEFDRVWIPNCNEGVFPYGKMLSEEQIEEERRIFYVAMTRAKGSLELFYRKGTIEHSGLPSRFLNPFLHEKRF